MNIEMFTMYFTYLFFFILVLGVIYFVIRYYFFPMEEKEKPIKKTSTGGIYEVIKQGDGKWIKK